MTLTLVALIVAAWLAPAEQAGGSEPAPATPPASPLDPPGRGPGGLPIVDFGTTGYPPGVHDEAEYQRFLDARADELSRAADASAAQPGAIGLHLAAANWILARQIEPAVSRILLGGTRSNDQSSVASAARLARDHIEKARDALQSETWTTQPEDRPGANPPAKRQLEILETFAQAIGAALGDGDPEALRKKRRDAAFRLALLLEEDEPALASAAGLWQAILLGRADRVDRALERLPLSTSPPPPRVPRFGFYARLLRCRYLADQGRYVAAYSLLMQIERRCHDWFTTPQDRADAARTAARIRLQVAGQWRDTLDPAAEAERRWCRQAIERIHESWAAERDRPTLIRLGTAIPMLVTMPDPILGEPVAPTPQRGPPNAGRVSALTCRQAGGASGLTALASRRDAVKIARRFNAGYPGRSNAFQVP